MAEAITEFDCFGGRCAVLVSGTGPAGNPVDAAARARRRLLAWHGQFSRFVPDSELSRLNRDPRSTVPVSTVMAQLVEAALDWARRTEGLLDPTLGAELSAAGYAVSRSAAQAPPAISLGELVAGWAASRGPARSSHPAAASRDRRWQTVTVDRRRRTVTRPPGVTFDGGGFAKGVFGDILAAVLDGHDGFAVDAAGDVRLGGRSRQPRPVRIAAATGEREEVLHTFELVRGAVATSGLGRRAWRDAQGHVAHHLLDPGTGQPAMTGLVQVSALAPTGVEAEARAKAALLSGAQAAPRWLPHGGVIVADDGAVRVIDAAAALTDGHRGRALAA